MCYELFIIFYLFRFCIIRQAGQQKLQLINIFSYNVYENLLSLTPNLIESAEYTHVTWVTHLMSHHNLNNAITKCIIFTENGQ